jgi:hypothetical protein
MELYLSHPMSASVTVLTPEPAKLDAINHAFSRSAPEGGIEGELVYIGRNMTADPFDAPLVDYDAVDVKGKIVLDDGFPAPYRAYATEEAGAIAQIYINPDDRLHNMTVTTIWGAPTPETKDRLPRNPIVAMKRGDGDALRDRLARGEKVRVRIEGVVDTRWRKTELVVARIEGSAEKETRVRAREPSPLERRSAISPGAAEARGEPGGGIDSRGDRDRAGSRKEPLRRLRAATLPL